VTAKAQGQVLRCVITQAVERIGHVFKRVGSCTKLGLSILGLCYTFANLVATGLRRGRNGPGASVSGPRSDRGVNEWMMLRRGRIQGIRLVEAVEWRNDRADRTPFRCGDRHGPPTKRRSAEIRGRQGRRHRSCGVASARCIIPTDARSHQARSSRLHGPHDGRRDVGSVSLYRGYKRGVVAAAVRRNRTLRQDIFGSVDDFLNQFIRAPEISASATDGGHAGIRG